MRRKVAAALVVALAVVGCGGSGTTTVSGAQAVRRLEAACQAGTLEAQKVARSGAGRDNAAKAVRAKLETILGRIDKLETSGAAKADFDTYKDTVRRRLDGLKRIASADDEQKAFAAEQPAMEAAGQRALAAMTRLGATHVCI
jgi:hypothetical protein